MRAKIADIDDLFLVDKRSVNSSVQTTDSLIIELGCHVDLLFVLCLCFLLF